jgi:hypothetical protein
MNDCVLEMALVIDFVVVRTKDHVDLHSLMNPVSYFFASQEDRLGVPHLRRVALVMKSGHVNYPLKDRVIDFAPVEQPVIYFEFLNCLLGAGPIDFLPRYPVNFPFHANSPPEGSVSKTVPSGAH